MVDVHKKRTSGRLTEGPCKEWAVNDDATKYKTAWGNYAVENEMLKQAASRFPFLLYLQLCTGS